MYFIGSVYRPEINGIQVSRNNWKRQSNFLLSDKNIPHHYCTRLAVAFVAVSGHSPPSAAQPANQPANQSTDSSRANVFLGGILMDRHERALLFALLRTYLENCTSTFRDHQHSCPLKIYLSKIPNRFLLTKQFVLLITYWGRCK